MTTGNYLTMIPISPMCLIKESSSDGDSARERTRPIFPLRRALSWNRMKLWALSWKRLSTRTGSADTFVHEAFRCTITKTTKYSITEISESGTRRRPGKCFNLRQLDKLLPRFHLFKFKPMYCFRARQGSSFAIYFLAGRLSSAPTTSVEAASVWYGPKRLRIIKTSDRD